MRQSLVVAAMALASLCACSNSQPSTFGVAGAAVDATYFCPGGANNTRYDLHGTIDVRNSTSHAVTIQSISAEMTLVGAQGAWLQKPGDRYDAGDATFSPKSVGPGASAKVDLVIASSCTSDKYESGGSSRGDYSVTMHLVTSAGSYSVTAANRHAILAA